MTDKRIEVLRAIDQSGSISQAARVNAISYKAAWQAIETLSNLAAVPLIEKAVGGTGGGGARLTPHGRALLTAADRLRQAKALALAQVKRELDSGHAPALGIAHTGFKMSMRNQIPCHVRDIETTDGAPCVQLELADGQRLASRITSESLELLDLKPHQPVIALCKATAVTIAPAFVASRHNNVLRGIVSAQQDLRHDGQVTLAVGSTIQLSGFAQTGVHLQSHDVAMASIADSAIVIGVPD